MAETLVHIHAPLPCKRTCRRATHGRDVAFIRDGAFNALHASAAFLFGATQHFSATPWQLCASNWSAVRGAMMSVFAGTMACQPAHGSPDGLLCPV